MGKISEEMRLKIINELISGCSQRKLSRMLQIGQTTIRKIWLKYSKTGDIADIKKPGRKVIYNTHEKRILCRESKKSPFSTAAEVLTNSNIGKNISLCTARRYLREGLLFGRIAPAKPLLSKKIKKQRLLFCKENRKYNGEDWKYVMFSDESKFERYSLRRKYVRRLSGMPLKYKYVCTTVKQRGFSIMVWGVIKGDGTRKLIKCPNTLNSKEYQSILDSGLIAVYDYDSIFMQDGAPCHRSKSTMAYLKNKDVEILENWPPYSPDLNIFENLWSIVKNQVSLKSPINKEQLWNEIQTAWEAIDRKVIDALYMSIPRRIEAIIKCRGGHSKY